MGIQWDSTLAVEFDDLTVVNMNSVIFWVQCHVALLKFTLLVCADDVIGGKI
jgi:hypothetical protein